MNNSKKKKYNIVYKFSKKGVDLEKILEEYFLRKLILKVG